VGLSVGSTTTVQLPTRAMLSRRDVVQANARFETAAASEIVEWAVERFGPDLALAASFADTLLIDLALKVDADIRVVFLDTGFHLAETLDTVRQAMRRYRLNLEVARPDADAADLWSAGPDACCEARKVATLERALGSSRAWLSGLRRSDSSERSATPVVEIDRRGLVKINPIASWTDDDVDRYIAEHDVIVNPLVGQGYASIGCWPCTVPTVDPADPRSGRWAGLGKTECGLHW
jgi:phosphoadenosine phosphosulfate reductase